MPDPTISPLDANKTITTDDLLEDARELLRTEAERFEIDPLTNSVFALARSFLRRISNHELGFGDIECLVHALHEETAAERATALYAQHFPESADIRWAKLQASLEALASTNADEFRTKVETPPGGIVFTGHPTYAASRTLREAMAAYATAPSESTRNMLADATRNENRNWPNTISLASEHEEAQNAISNARDAATIYGRYVVESAQAAGIDWRSLTPALPTLSTWVGYDLDGRTDIHWSQSIALRLYEKTRQLRDYSDRLEAISGFDGAPSIIADMARELKAAADLCTEETRLFSRDLTDAEELATAANFLTRHDPRRMVSLTALRGKISDLITDPETPDDVALELSVFRSLTMAIGLGTARIHLRLNAAQIRSVIQRDLAMDSDIDDIGRLAMKALAEMSADAEALPVNFADLFLEQSTARRQFLMCAQIIKHIDADTPIRFLIAESENPATVMGALYLARQYGVAEKLDISPLFETPEALETGGRFVEQLLEQPDFLRYLESRGRLCLQFGFSDAGRFIGQIAADMAIERIHNLVSRALAQAIPGMPLLLFNTHGESMGRGGYPGSFEDRLNHVLTPWNRANCKKRGIPLQHEVSFQGGDGFLHFATPELAETALLAFSAHCLNQPGEIDDPFYNNTAFMWDFYRALFTWHQNLFVNRDYGHLLGDFANGFLIRAGSRQTRRAGGNAGPRALRAISHNATLQQLGVPLNTASGLGSAMQKEKERLVRLISTSHRLRHLIQLASKARTLTSIPVLRAYAKTYDPSFYVALSRDTDPRSGSALRRVNAVLKRGQTTTSIHRIADHLSIDMGKFDSLLEGLKSAPSAGSRHEARLDLHILHAVRQALIMRAFTLVGSLHSISPRHDIDVLELVELVTQLQIDEAVTTLKRVYPIASKGSDALRTLDEPGHLDPDASKHGYTLVHLEIITPLETISDILHQVSLAIAHAYGAYG